MSIADSIIRVDYLNTDGSIAGSVNGLIMSYYDQSVIFTPFEIDKRHFSHLKNAICIMNDKIIHLNISRLAHPFLLRIWEIPFTGINPASELTISIPKKNHRLYDLNKQVNEINSIDFSIWHQTLPPILAHEIPIIVPIGTVIYFNDKITGYVVTHKYNKSIIINTYSLKQLICGYDYNYANIYYNVGINHQKQFYIKEDWDLYENCLQRHDIILSIEDIPIDREMSSEEFKIPCEQFQMPCEKLGINLYINTWLTYMYMEKDNVELSFRIIRNNKEMIVKVPRKPLYTIMQIPYYSDDESKISFEQIYLTKD